MVFSLFANTYLVLFFINYNYLGALILLLLTTLANFCEVQNFVVSILRLFFGFIIWLAFIIRPWIIWIIQLRFIIYVNTKLLLACGLHRHLVCQSHSFQSALSTFSRTEVPSHQFEIGSIQDFGDVLPIGYRHYFVVRVDVADVFSFRIYVFLASLSCICIVELDCVVPVISVVSYEFGRVLRFLELGITCLA